MKRDGMDKYLNILLRKEMSSVKFVDCFVSQETILMEGALGERLKREYGIRVDDVVALASVIYSQEGAQALTKIWKEYIEIAKKYQLPFLATTPTRRVNHERIQLSGYTEKLIYDNVAFFKNIQKESGITMYAGGLLGCKGDAYTGAEALNEQDAYEFHGWAAQHFANAGADFLSAGIMPVLSEAVGMARAFEDTKLPYIISFTIEENGRLIDGTSISDAIKEIDAATIQKPVCYMTNCVHPSILRKALNQPFNQNELVKDRFRGIQANTSPLSYAELDGAVDLKCSEPEDFADEMIKLSESGTFKIWGGCCGTDCRHMECVAKRLMCMNH